jgi:hypothetical protein
VEEQLKEVLVESHSAQLMIELLQEELNKNQECGSIEPPSIGVWESSVENIHGD